MQGVATAESVPGPVLAAPLDSLGVTVPGMTCAASRLPARRMHSLAAMTPNIIVADDDAGTRELIKTALSGFDVVEAGDGVELLELLADASMVALIVTDVDMGWFDGIQAAAAARAAGVSTPIILISGKTGPAIASRAARIPDSTLLHKPFSLSAFVALARCMATRRPMYRRG